ncbi:MAG TPA: glycoside hydrolase family 2 TIM barrel-domain containing protein [Chitinophagaceae bacterium]|nr:glycoside hydrolase family 2 TIM barrel-domain containing protein [Chitinophagaceae bacterium]
MRSKNFIKGLVLFFCSIPALFSAAQHGELLALTANPPAGTKIVRFYVDDMLVSNLTDLYSVKTNTIPVWKTCIDPSWIGAGEHELRIESETAQGVQTIEKRKIRGTASLDASNLISLNGAWQFAEMNELPAGALEGSEPLAVKPGYKAGTWTKIIVPNSLGAINEKWNKYEGILGIYRKNVELNAAKTDQLFIVLESVYWSGRVFVNGVEVGQTVGGYLPSRFDISKAAVNGKNEIAIIVDNRFSTMGAFKRLNEFYWNWGGLVQEVAIEKHPALSLTDLRAEGTMAGGLQLHLTGLNAGSAAKNKNIVVEVYDAANKKVLGPVQINLSVPAGSSVIKLKELQLNKPVLWELEKPYLYTVVVKGDLGELKERTGFRDVKVQGSDILLNGKAVHGLQGFNRHADYPGLGRTQPGALVYQELKMLHDKGFRIFRPAHYPTTPAMLDAADELGFLVIEEVNVTGLRGAIMASKEVKEFGIQQLTKMIHRDRSHPSVIAWSVGNENFTEEEGAEEYIKETIAAGKALDSKRLYTQVTHRHTTDRTFPYQDFVAQNYYAGWYAKDINAIVNLFDAIQAYSGNKPVMLSEYGAEAVSGRAGTAKSTEFYQGFVVDAHNRLLNGRPHFIGKMYWCSTDFWCRPNWTGGSPDPVPPFHVKSLIDPYREHKKLGWKVIFSPIRLLFNPHTVRANDLGGEIELTPGKDTTIRQAITIKDIRNKGSKGILSIELPSAFSTERISYPFAIEPGGSISITVFLKGKLSAGDKPVECFFKAVIDEDTEAQPLLLILKPKEPAR